MNRRGGAAEGHLGICPPLLSAFRVDRPEGAAMTGAHQVLSVGQPPGSVLDTNFLQCQAVGPVGAHTRHPVR